MNQTEQTPQALYVWTTLDLKVHSVHSLATDVNKSNCDHELKMKHAVSRILYTIYERLVHQANKHFEWVTLIRQRSGSFVQSPFFCD